ncbi:hypothetical protein [Streptomyces brevispora]|uniref:hypothetical protein n=1 Tax=Streptomyces brevispora TaxID=887462 RepID=UPI003826A337
MRTRTSRSVSVLAAVTLYVAALGAVSGCGGSPQSVRSGDTETQARRAQQVAAAWDGSAAAGAWRNGFHPMSDVMYAPSGGLRSKADRQAYEDHSFVLEGELPATAPKGGLVAWSDGRTLTRPLTGAAESYRALAGGARVGGRPHLTVTGARLGGMSVATTRGPAVIPAWLFRLKGYAAPLERAAVTASELPRPPVKGALHVPGFPLGRMVRMSADGRSVTVVALHGVCDKGPAVDVLETRGSVVLSASVKAPAEGGHCTKQGKLQEVTVRLGQSLGDRVLLDAHTGRPVFYRPPHGPSPSWS